MAFLPIKIVVPVCLISFGKLKLWPGHSASNTVLDFLEKSFLLIL